MLDSKNANDLLKSFTGENNFMGARYLSYEKGFKKKRMFGIVPIGKKRPIAFAIASSPRKAIELSIRKSSQHLFKAIQRKKIK